MKRELTGNRAAAPLLDEIVAQDLGFDFRANGHPHLQVVAAPVGGRVPGQGGHVESRIARTPSSDSRKNDSAMPGRSMMGNQEALMLRLSPSPPPVEHRSAVEVNPDASLSLVGRDTRACAGHGRNARNTALIVPASLAYRSTADQLRTGFGAVHLATVAVAANEGTERIGPPLPSARSHRADQISTGRGVLWNNLPAQVFGTLWGSASGKLGGLHRCRACSVRQRHFYRMLRCAVIP